MLLSGDGRFAVYLDSAADGNTITISVTGISKGVKLYSIDYKYLAAE